MSYATIAMVTWVGPFGANAWVQISVPKFTGTPELALGPRPPDTTLTRWLYDQLRRAMLTAGSGAARACPLPATLLDSMGYRGAWWSTSSSSCEPKRELYGVRLAALRDSATRYLKGAVELPDIQAGLNSPAYLVNGMKSNAAAVRAAACGVEVRSIDRFVLRRSDIQGVLVGFAASPTRRSAKP